MRWDEPLGALQDARRQGRIPTEVIVRAVMGMSLCRLGSLNALGQTGGSSFWRRWLGRELPSPDTIGRAACLVDLERFTTWPQVRFPVRVVRSHESRPVRRQLDRQEQTLDSDWWWVTTLPEGQAPAGAVVQMGHHR